MIGFRVDANEEIATGHLRRCITLAEQLEDLGETCIFLLANEVSYKYMKKYGFFSVILNGKWDDWDDDIRIVSYNIMRFGISCLFVDSYQVTAYFLSKINQIIPVVYLDDICKQPYDITALVCTTQSKRAERIPFLYKNNNVKILSGSKYLILRKEFYFITKERETQTREKIMITTGGTDPFHITLEIINEYLKDSFLRNYDLIAILGAMNQDSSKIVSFIREIGEKHIKILQDINNMGDVMRSCSAAISAGGGTVYELCACQIPTVCIAFTDDQAEFGADLERKEILQYAGDIRKNTSVTVKNTIKKLKAFLEDSNCREKCIFQMQQFTDGLGAFRIANEIMKLKKE